MSAIANIKARMQADLQGGMRCIEVPEWGESAEKPLVIWYTPETPAQRSSYEKAFDSPSQLYVQAIVARAKNEDGSRMFSAGEATELSNWASMDVIRRVGEALFSDAGLGVEDAGKP